MNIQLKLEEDPFVLHVQNEEGIGFKMDAAPKIGGKNAGMRPMEALASSLAGCMSIDVLLILRKQRQEVKQFEVAVDAQRKDEVPSPFEHITLVFSTNPEVDLEKLRAAVHLSHDKYCSVSASLHPSISFDIQVKHI